MKKTMLKLLPIFTIILVPITSTMTSCSRIGGKIVFANYESYFSTDLIDDWQSDVSFLTYSNENDIKQKFEKNYDLAVPTSAAMLEFMEQGMLAQIDWTAFGKIASDKYSETGEYSNSYLLDISGNPITNGREAEDLLADSSSESLVPSKQFIEALDEYAWENDYFPNYYKNTHDSSTCSVLDFCLPYFFQNFSFLYKGDEIESISGDSVSWDDINKAVGGKNSGYDTRFKESQKNKVLMVDDVRTIYDVSRLSHGEENINPDGNMSINDYENEYKTFFSNYAKDQLLLNSDSGMLTATFTESGSINNGLFAYNGDAILTATGAGEDKYADYWAQKWLDYHNDGTNGKPMNYVAPSENVIALDTVVLNKNSVKYDINEGIATANLDDSKTYRVYEFMFSVLLDHIDYQDNPIYSTDDDGDYLYDSMRNFDWVLYSSPWERIDNYCSGKNEDDENYFYDFTDSLMSDLEGYEEGDNEEWTELLSDIYKINLSDNIDNCTERPISDATKSDMRWGYLFSKEII